MFTGWVLSLSVYGADFLKLSFAPSLFRSVHFVKNFPNILRLREFFMDNRRHFAMGQGLYGNGCITD